MRFNIAALALLGFMAVLAWGAALGESVTTDEVAHVAAGLSYLQKFDMRYNEEHPPLSKVLAAIPLVASGVRADYTGPVWTRSSSFFVGMAGQWIFGYEVLMRWNHPRTTLMLARVPMMLLTLLLGWCIFTFTRSLAGNRAGILCLAVYVSTPLFLELGPLVMTDVALTLFALLTTWTFATLWQAPTRRNMILFSLALGAALLSKFSSVILFPAIGTFVALSWRSSDSERRARLRTAATGIMLSALWVYLFYLILSWNQPADIPGLSRTGWGALAGRLLMPPWLFFRGVVLFLVMVQKTAYVLGHYYWHGIWFFFPVLLVLKSAPGFLLLLALLPAVGLRSASEALPHHWRMLWVTCAVFSGTCILSHYNMEFRHFSFPLVLLIMMLAALPGGIARLSGNAARRIALFATVLAVTSCLVTAVRAYPYYVPYISELFAGRSKWTLVGGGNLDRNQGLFQASEFAQAHGLKEFPIQLAYMGDVADQTPLGVPWSCLAATPSDAGKWVAISAGAVLPGHICEWMLQYPHEDLAGGSMLAFHMPSTVPAPGTSGRPTELWVPVPSFGVNGDLETIFLSLLDHPETFPAVLPPFEAAVNAEVNKKVTRVRQLLRLR